MRNHYYHISDLPMLYKRLEFRKVNAKHTKGDEKAIHLRHVKYFEQEIQKLEDSKTIEVGQLNLF